MKEVYKLIKKSQNPNQWALENKLNRVEIDLGEISYVYSAEKFGFPNKVIKISREPQPKEIYSNPNNPILNKVFLKYTWVSNSGKYAFAFQDRCFRPWGVDDDDDDIILQQWDKLNNQLKKERVGSISRNCKVLHDVGYYNCGLNGRGKLIVFDW